MGTPNQGELKTGWDPVLEYCSEPSAPHTTILVGEAGREGLRPRLAQAGKKEAGNFCFLCLYLLALIGKKVQCLTFENLPGASPLIRPWE